MDFNKLQTLIEKGETAAVEFKKSIAELDKLGKTLCGFLNNKGGTACIGVTDLGKMIGLEVTDSTKKKLAAFRNHFDPWPELFIEYVPIPNSAKQIITIRCESALKSGPSTYKGRPYLRNESSLEKMSAEIYKSRLLEHAGLSKAWEHLPANTSTLADLDHTEIRKTLKIGISEGRIPEEDATDDIKEILVHFDLLNNDHLSNAAVVLFAKKMPADYSQCFIRMGRFIDDTMDEALDSKQLRGNAFQILSEAQEFVRRNLPITSRYNPNQFERIDEQAVPILAVREAIINAICHRDYAKKSGDISLLIFNDCLEIHNVGRLYGGLTVDQLSKRHPSRRRNERIAQVFFARKLIDRWGGGTRRILRLCAQQYLPAPEFSESHDGLMVRFPFKTPIGPVRITTPDGLSNKATTRQTEILQILANNGSLPLRNIMAYLTNPPAARTIGDDLAYLKSLQLVDTEGVGRAAVWHLTTAPQKNGAVMGRQWGGNGAVMGR